jgi:RNA-dependent RNA polymerase
LYKKCLRPSSGSDLDGDLYFVCWEKSLIWRGKDRKPGDYDTPPKDEQRSQESLISREMIIDFFLEFMHNDYKLGQIADTHVRPR